VRIDSGVREGDAITPHYDSMIAKLIVHGEDRAAALARLDTALSELHITGLSHNVSFLRRVAATASFAQADLDTALIEREHSALFEAPSLPIAHAVAGALLRLQADEQHHSHRDPWSRTDHWRLHGDARRLVKLHIDGQTLAVMLDIQRNGTWQLSWDAVNVTVQPLCRTDAGGEQFEADVHGQRLRLSVYRHGDELDVFTPQGHARVQRVDPLRQADEAAAGGRLTALMPGKVVAMLVTEGQQVKQGDALAVTEAMKMEHTLTAPYDGTVSAILCAVGDQLAEGVELLRLEAAA
jgi:3-methylcrotonyl-CoA carboxylase alpha subunit